jgi:hypothetical protein
MADLPSLPGELLCQILELSRPGDFENFMLSCKQVYYAGSTIIRDHSLCKSLEISLASNLVGPLDSEDSSITSLLMPSFRHYLCNPYLFFRGLLELPAETRINALWYLERVALVPDRPANGETPPDLDGLALHALKRHSPWLYRALEHDIRDGGFIETFPKFFDQNREGHIIPQWYILFILCLFPNVKFLDLDGAEEWLGKQLGLNAMVKTSQVKSTFRT